MKVLTTLMQRVIPRHRQPACPAVVEDSLEVYDVTPFAADIDLKALDVVQWAPVWMTRGERLLLYTLTFTLRPSRYLEIGTFKGGSALVVAAAMDAADSTGRMICIDPEPRIAPEHWEKIAHRTTLLTGFSPDILPRAYDSAGGLFNFVLIDGDHTRAGVLRDAVGVLPYVADRGYLLFHDSLYSEVAAGIESFAEQHSDVVDFGTLTREVTYLEDDSGRRIRWGGLRMMQVRRAKPR
ncbi:MAG: class I SAM-dependent methyltransferase [Candidatus Promineifilaceae bacterium]|nr:class I SAM-dependent methyltransferase [Candidatus Promineifilaceae bacterium]